MLTFTSVYTKNEGLILSPQELLSLYFYGIPIQNKLGTTLSENDIKVFIQSATEQVEKYLDIKIAKQVIEEDLTYYKTDYANWSFIPVSYPVKTPHALYGYYSGIKQIDYPLEWISARKTSDGETYYRQMFLVPTGALTAGSAQIIQSGVLPSLHFLGQRNIPNYWKARYCTGFDKVPKDLLGIIGKYASLFIFDLLGDIILGAGIASLSLGIDGLSQSISTTQSAENSGFSGRINSYQKELKSDLPKLHDYYKGLTFMGV